MEEKNQNNEEKKNLTQEEIEDVQGGSAAIDIREANVYKYER